jgi:hypothetical protein
MEHMVEAVEVVTAQYGTYEYNNCPASAILIQHVQKQ